MNTLHCVMQSCLASIINHMTVFAIDLINDCAGVPRDFWISRQDLCYYGGKHYSSMMCIAVGSIKQINDTILTLRRQWKEHHVRWKRQTPMIIPQESHSVKIRWLGIGFDMEYRDLLTKVAVINDKWQCQAGYKLLLMCTLYLRTFHGCVLYFYFHKGVK